MGICEKRGKTSTFAIAEGNCKTLTNHDVLRRPDRGKCLKWELSNPKGSPKVFYNLEHGIDFHKPD